MLIVMSMFFLTGCDMSLGPILDLKGNDLSYYYYTATITVSYENGDPCTTAFAKSKNEEWYYSADSAGVVKFCEQIWREEYSAPTKPDSCIVYKARNEEIIWEGIIQLIRYNEYPDVMPKPAVEIVIPDNLRQ